MLQITIPSVELYDEVNDLFVSSREQTLQLEHSLVSLSKWESKWKKPFLSTEDKTFEESIDYIRCMTLTQNVNDTVYKLINRDLINKVAAYIGDSMTATTFQPNNKPPSREIVTSEILYYRMIALNIPFECQKWHLNRLLTLMNVCNIKNQPPSKINKSELINRNKSLNEARKQALNTKG